MIKKEELRKAALCYAYPKNYASGKSLPRFNARMHRHHHGTEFGHNKAGGANFHVVRSSLMGRIIPQTINNQKGTPAPNYLERVFRFEQLLKLESVQLEVLL
jgi:hypothetical protein